MLLLKREKKGRRRRHFFKETITRDEKGTSYDGEENIKIMKPLFDGITKNMTYHLIKGFKLMASQLRGKLVEGGSRSFRHGETHNTIHFECCYDWLNEFRKNNLNLNSLRNNQQCTSMEETKEPPISVGGET